MSATFWTNTLFLAATLTTAQLLLRVAISRGDGADYMQLVLGQWPLIALSLGLFGVNFLYYIFALQRAPIALIYPTYTAITLALIFLAGTLIFNEAVTPMQVAGLVLLCIAIFLISP